MECIANKRDVDLKANSCLPPALCTFGVISDIQYADHDNGMNYGQTSHRYYRDALCKLDSAVKIWNDSPACEFVLQLGDLLDGICKRNGKSEEAYTKLMESFDKCKCEVKHVLGNHELYNFTRAQLLDKGFCPANMLSDNDSSMYYEFTVHSRFRFVILDCYEVAVMGAGKHEDKAKELIAKHNPNAGWNDSTGMDSATARYVAYNGGLSDHQLDWLKRVLGDAQKMEQVVIVAGHLPMLDNSVFRSSYMCWNQQDVLTILHSHPCVKLYLCGHVHCFNHVSDRAGLHHVSMPGVVETCPGVDACALVHCYGDSLVIQGYGTVPNVTIQY